MQVVPVIIDATSGADVVYMYMQSLTIATIAADGNDMRKHTQYSLAVIVCQLAPMLVLTRVNMRGNKTFRAIYRCMIPIWEDASSYSDVSRGVGYRLAMF